MNFDFAEQINPYLEKHDFSKAISIAETALQNIPPTEFHSVLGQSLVHLAFSLGEWIDNFYEAVSRGIEVKALYFMMNEFDINTDSWYIDGFAYSEDGGLDLDDMEWLCNVGQETMTTDEFRIVGYERLQEVFENIEPDTDDLQNARDWCEQIIIARFMELIWTAHRIAKEKKLRWAYVPVYFTEHEYDFIVKSDGNMPAHNTAQL